MNFIEGALTLLYLALVVNSLLSAGKDLVRKQMVFQGKLLFLLIVLLIYYRNFSFGIPFWDTVLTNPAKNAMDLLDSFLKLISGGGVSIAPPQGYKVIFSVILPASFVYYFVEQWFLYAFLDRRVSKLAGFFALFLFISRGYSC